jgi:hypothetical protein
MKYFLLTLLLFVASAFAQTIRIDAPASGQTLQPGKRFTAKLTLLVINLLSSIYPHGI